MKLLILLIVLGALSGCSTTEKEAQKSLEKQNYNKAIMLFSRVLEHAPKNDNALAGLEAARNGWIDKALLKVRLLRLSGNEIKSTNLLNTIYNSQNNWDTYPKGPVAFTQKEETEFATKFILKQSQESLNKNLPLKAFHIVHEYDHMFSSGSSIANKDIYLNTVNKVGANKCKQLKSEIKKNEFYFGSLINNYCTFWSQPVKSLTQQKNNYSKSLISYLSLELTNELNSLQLKTINKALEKSPWYNKFGKKLNLVSNSKYDYTHSYKPKRYTHEYTVSVPYEDSYEREKNDNGKGIISAIGDIIDAFSAASGNGERVSDNGDGTETVYQTLYRDESRYYKYTGTEHTENYKYKARFKSESQDFPLIIFYENFEKHTSKEHDIKNPDINLSPKIQQLYGSKDWINKEQHKLEAKFLAEIEAAWTTKHCKSNIRESILRCSTHLDDLTKISKTNNKWFKDSFGIDAKAVKLLLGRIL